jgi:transcriptional regulator with XRE-family HTH domain
MAGSRHSLRVVSSGSFGSRLRAQRRADDMTQGELAKRFRVSQQTIGAWERGERPQSRFIRELANYLGLNGEQELMSLIDSNPEHQVDPDEVSEATDELSEAEANAATMRLLAENFVENQRRDPLPSGQAAGIYRDFIQYFQTR